jgi:hypothetical protein
MEQEPPEEERFLRNILDLTDLIHELSSICWDAGHQDINPTLVALARGYLEGYDKVKLINTFIKYSHVYWEDEIKNRKEDFFIEHANEIFVHLPINTDNINAFKILFTSVDEDGEYIVIDEDRDAIWEIFGSLVKICLKYIHKIRGIKFKPTPDGLRPVYKKNIYPEIPVRKLAKIWDVDLPIGKQ